MLLIAALNLIIKREDNNNKKNTFRASPRMSASENERQRPEYFIYCGTHIADRHTIYDFNKMNMNKQTNKIQNEKE